ncbi:hypothetical protein [Actinoplanes sp. DH11]|uniref:hypothetical protein n=1 Tax=Actinoplanes sp. DH11 TaxID=2857011 RepID=UPI001E60676C|nr:hypothetical protein [Actinoplanes sp. DH11]
MSQPPYDPSGPEQPSYGQPSYGPPAPEPPSYGPPSSAPPAYGPPSSAPPAYGPPSSAPPAYGQPSSAPPAYGPPPGYPGQPGYPEQSGYPAQPGYPAPGQSPYGPPPGYPMAPPPKKSKVLPIVLISIAVFLVLCVGGVSVLFLIGKDAAENDRGTVGPVTASEPATAPETTAPGTTAPATPEETRGPAITIVEPRTLGGRPKLTDGQFAGITKQLRDGLAAGYPGSKSIGALYGEVENQDIVIAIGIATDIPDPEAALAGTFAGIGIGGLKVKNLTDAGTGDLGGVAQCGTAETSGIDVAVCSWADEGSIGMFMWYFKTAAKVKAEFPKLRAQIEKKS